MRDPDKKRAYEREYHKRRYHERRETAVEQLGGKCEACGTIEQLEIDHVDRSTKSFDLGSMWSVSQSRFDAELAKCQLLCKICHKKKTDKELTTRTHGTHAMYRRGNCRCDVCIAANRAYARALYDKKRKG